MITIDEIKKFIEVTIEEEFGNEDNQVIDFSKLDSFDKLAIIMQCEKEYLISIDETEIDAGCDNQELAFKILYLIKK
jgi:acyl carrier protein